MGNEIANGVHWVGVVDWERRLFHGHELSTHRGSSYNAYLIVDEKIALVDTVWHRFTDGFLEKIERIVDPAKIDYVVINHAEPDHSGALPAVMARCPDATVVVSKKGAQSVPGHYHTQWKTEIVDTGDKMSLGGRELTFVAATMLHWPDTMFTHLSGDNILFSNDAFGQHYATDFRTNDRVDAKALFEEALKYYANILTPFSTFVTKKIAELEGLGLPVSMIAPSHGVIWRDDPMQIVAKYKAWAAQTPERRALILYDTMWEATRDMALAIAKGLEEEGVEHQVYHLAVTDRNDVITDIFRSKALVIGSPTINNGALPTIPVLLEDLRCLKFKNKIGAAFGSYGWSGESTKIIAEGLDRAKIPLAAEPLRAKWRPAADDLEACRGLGRQVAKAVNAG